MQIMENASKDLPVPELESSHVCELVEWYGGDWLVIGWSAVGCPVKLACKQVGRPAHQAWQAPGSRSDNTASLPSIHETSCWLILVKVLRQHNWQSNFQSIASQNIPRTGFRLNMVEPSIP